MALTQTVAWDLVWDSWLFSGEKWSEVKSLSRVQLFVTPWAVAYQAPLSMGFSRQECWSGLPFPSPGDLPSPRIEPRSPGLQADSLLFELQGRPNENHKRSNGLPYLQANKIACHSSMEAGRWHGTPGSETDFIMHGKRRTQSVSICSNFLSLNSKGQ